MSEKKTSRQTMNHEVVKVYEKGRVIFRATV